MLPGNIEAQYGIYNDLESSYARIFLPSKVRTFSVLRTNADAASDVLEASLLPECVGLDQVLLRSSCFA